MEVVKEEDIPNSLDTLLSNPDIPNLADTQPNNNLAIQPHSLDMELLLTLATQLLIHRLVVI